jgi:hypothetical protein
MCDVTVAWPKELIVRPLTVADAERIAQWRYEGRWKVYDSRPDNGLMSDNPAYLAVAGAHGGPLVGFCCAGLEAMVPGLPIDEGVLDVGVGMDPVLVGQGHGGNSPVLCSTITAAPRERTGCVPWCKGGTNAASG